MIRIVTHASVVHFCELAHGQPFAVGEANLQFVESFFYNHRSHLKNARFLAGNTTRRKPAHLPGVPAGVNQISVIPFDWAKARIFSAIS